MHAAYFRGNGIIEHVDVPTPEPGEGQVLIRVAANAVCGSDHKALDGGHKTIPGHEVVGTVVRTGPGVEMAEGTRVAAYIPLHCGECPYCRRGAGNLCPHKKGLLGWSTDGGYAEYMLLPERNALALDDRISFAEGALLLDTIGTSGHGLRLSRCWEAESVLVLGAGPIGVGALAMLRAYGVPNVYVSEPSAYRRGKVAEMRATAIDPATENVEGRIRADYPYGVDIVFEAAGLWPTILQSFDLVRPGGTINLVGEYWGRIEIDRPKGSWMINDINLIRSFYFTIPEFYENQHLILEGKLDAAPLATHTYPLKELRAAYDLFRSGQALKVLVEP